MKRLLMETTQITPERTAAEIQELLVEAGARQVVSEYNDKREITGIHFIMNVNNQHIPFQMPVRTDALFNHFKRRAAKGSYRNRNTDKILEKAKRIAWRQLLRWIEAQLAFIDAGMAETAEVFMPYVQVAANETLYHRMVAQGLDRLALPEKTG